MATFDQKLIAGLYTAFFNRAPDAAGLSHWESELGAGETLHALAAGFAGHPVFTEQYGEMDDQAFVEAIYTNILGAAGDEEGIAFWVGQLEGGMSRSDFVAEFVYAALNYDGDDAAALERKAFLDNKAEVGVYYAETLGEASNLDAETDTSTREGLEADPAYIASQQAIAAVTADPASVETAKGAIDEQAPEEPVDPGVPGQEYTLTVNEDNLVGTADNDTFNAPVINVAGALQESLQNIDALDGGAGNDTLNVTLNGAAVTPTLRNIENVNVRATATGSELDLSGSTGVEKVTVANSTAAATISGLGAAAGVAVANQNENVVFKDSTAASLNVSLDRVGVVDPVPAKATQVQIDLATAAATSLNVVANASNVQVANATNVSSVSVAATGANQLDLTGAAGALTSLVVTGSGSVDTSAVDLTKVASLTAGDGGVNFKGGSAATAFTASTGAGDDTLAIVGGNVKSVSTGAGDDTVTVAGALAGTASVDLGAGDDTLVLNAAPTAGVTLNGGAGTDTLSVTAGIYDVISKFDAKDLAKITGFEVLGVTDELDGTIDLSKISGLTSVQTVGVATGKSASITNVGANAAVILKGDLETNDGALTVSLKDASGSSDVVNVTVNTLIDENNDATVNTTAAAIDLAVQNVETINVVSTGYTAAPATGAKQDVAENTLTLTADALNTLNISGDQALVFQSKAAMTKLATVDASANTAGVEIDATAHAGTAGLTIKGSASAANELTGSKLADTIVGGAGNDVITGGAGGDTLTGGAGNDTFVFGVGDSSIGTGKFDTITDFQANTFGNGTNGATGTGANPDATKWTGDVLEFAGDGGTGGVTVDVFNSAADAQTFLANNANTAAGLVAALDAATGNLYVDNTNDGVADFFIQLTGVTTIDEAAFVLV